jgi:niacin transporter
VYTALLMALGLVLSTAFHFLPVSGLIFLPMHIPILICGLICGAGYGVACGVAVPLLSHLVLGMPPAFILPQMVFELAAYGLVAGLLIRFVQTKNSYANIYIALIGAMLLGRIVFGVANVFYFQTGAYTMNAWLAAAFMTALPGIIIQIVMIPALVIALRKANLA